MTTRAIPALAFAGLMTASIAFAAQSVPSRDTDICALPTVTADIGGVELASMFTSNDADRDERSLFSDAPLFIYAMNKTARESDGVTLVDVSGVTSCASHKIIV